MSLEGLRAWIGEVERKLGKRTRVFLALSAIAIGISGASLYLAIEARNDSVSEGDVQALQEKLETRIDEARTTRAPVPEAEAPEAEPAPAPKPEESKPKPEGGTQGKDHGTSGGGGSAQAGEAGSTGSVPDSATGGAPSSAELQELLERAKQRSEATE